MHVAREAKECAETLAKATPASNLTTHTHSDGTQYPAGMHPDRMSGQNKGQQGGGQGVGRGDSQDGGRGLGRGGRGGGRGEAQGQSEKRDMRGVPCTYGHNCREFKAWVASTMHAQAQGSTPNLSVIPQGANITAILVENFRRWGGRDS